MRIFSRQKHATGLGNGAADGRKERGSSLVEVLVSLMILLFVLLGVLQLFTMALAVDRSSIAKNEMMGKAHAVVEIIRLARATNNGMMNGNDSGILPLGPGTRALPTSSLDINYPYWGPAGMGIVDPTSRFQISYPVTDGGTEWIVAVLAEPSQQSGSVGYIGSQNTKGVRYAAHIPK